MKISLVFLSLLILCALPALTLASEKMEYKSPDGRCMAVVENTAKRNTTDESRIFIINRKGKTVSTKDYSSDGGEHGFAVDKAFWTPDSKFFIYSMYSSGGHQPWRTPVDFYSVKDNRTLHLDDYAGLVRDGDLNIKAPDIVTVYVQRGDNYDDTYMRDVSLHSIIKKKMPLRKH